MRALYGGESGDPIPVGCKLNRNPPLGVLTVKPRDPSTPPKDDKPVDIKVNYISINVTLVGQIMSNQKFCSQKIFLYCAQEDTGNLSGNYAWYGRDGSKHYDWTRLPDDGEDVEHNCEHNAKFCNLCGNPQGYLVTQKDLLPVTRLVLAGTGIGVVFDNTECFDLLSSCQEIYDTEQRQTGYFGKNRYMIDVDKAGPLRPFRVICEFDKTTDNAVTVVRARYLLDHLL
ncbi:zonadhesin [Elysia marginata]|uniref:Zonadhesin n=1 Tax=Elysia marginata TaxID=1093978 RepID=A0AAV4EE36_9GAST|nr:zonadhesin [Elysia marginata]